MTARRVPDVAGELFVLLFAVGDFRRHFCFLGSRLPNDKEIFCAVCTQIRASFAKVDTLERLRGENSKEEAKGTKKKIHDFRFAF